MAVLLFCLVIVGTGFLLGYCIWVLQKKEKVDPELDEEKIQERILTVLYTNAGKKRKKEGSETLKIILLEELNISPKMLTKCLGKLFNKKLIMKTNTAVSLTSFGVEHYEVFIKPLSKDENNG